MNKYQYSSFNILISKIRNTIIELFCKKIRINACLFYSYGKQIHRNWGDDLNVFLVEKLFRRKVVYLYLSPLSIRLKKVNYIMIGSTIDMLCNEKSIIWGAGIIDNKFPLRSKPYKVLAVRGPLTRKYLLENGVDTPEIYGDPALLLKYVYQPKIKAKHKIGIIPHYSDYDSPLLAKFFNNDNILIIKMENYDNWMKVIDQVCSCDFIISSSLHGLILAETYSVPNKWIEINGSLLGGYFKFLDYYQSINLDINEPYKLKKDTEYNDILEMKRLYMKGSIDLKPLIYSAPFKIELKSYYN